MLFVRSPVRLVAASKRTVGCFRVDALDRLFQLLICPFLPPSYHRLNTAEIPCPEPILLRSHVLVMGFIGKDDM